ncbi:anthranilate phosphoribosyltransferase [Staphylococcus simulans]|uniref:anthranilate phosphoribosyltransferase n=1 Tax=Staphylococcus simulans TaxID=1286 RepID=UPI000D1DB036|nr:anthranilate phosphoribosyltransferase [Staphylococcus simulans]PTJ25938.1 anthranilate phosphoribosyltransferase [Staphylococcus simulans]RIN67301.1 anthranilate phosphoribosyltransferase [Staphylococcus simulans]
MTLIQKIQTQPNLTQQDINTFIQTLINPDIDNETKAELLRDYTARPLNQTEVTYLVAAMIQTMYPVQPVYPGAMCVCGTGGDKSNSFNISTTASFIVAAAGVNVLKHGNRSITSASGSSDLLNKMGITSSQVTDVETRMQETGLAFLNATDTYPVMKYIQPIRKMLEGPTIFNILGPMIHPFKLEYQVVGVYNPEFVKPMAETLYDLGRKRAIVLHGANGMDEATLSGENIIYEVNQETGITSYHLNAEDVGLTPASNETLKGGTPAENLEITLNILTGKDHSNKRDVVVLNAGIALYVAEKADSIQEGVTLAQQLIDEGKAFAQYKKTGGQVYDYIG